MNAYPMYVGAARIKPSAAEVSGHFLSLGSESFYRIANYDLMSPFFMSIASASDHWLFISSNGGLTAGRQDPDNALFPYYTEDKIHDNVDHTGSRTILRVIREGKRFLWEPYSRQSGAFYDVSRNLYKNVYGNKLMFEEVNNDLQLIFRYTWTLSDRFGFVKRSELVNASRDSASVEVLDGIENILPWGVVEFFQNKYSCLGDAYKAERAGRRERPRDLLPSARFQATAPSPPRLCGRRSAGRHVLGMPPGCFPPCSSTRSAAATPCGRRARVCGRRGAFFVQETKSMAPGGQQDWLIVADVDYGLSEIASLKRTLRRRVGLEEPGLRRRRRGHRRLAAIVARADGLQQTGDRLGSAHHFSNVLFNVMRGGVFESPIPFRWRT